MPASQYVASVAYHIGQDADEEAQILSHLKDRLRFEVGRQMLEEIETHGKQGMIKLDWLQMVDPDYFGTMKLALRVHFSPALFVDNYRVHVEPEFHYPMLAHPDRDPIPIEWQCAYCGQTNEVEKHLECRRCGAPRRTMR